MTILHAEHLCLGYGDRRVVDDLTLTVPPGRVTVVVGPNACGKSTFLRGLARLLPPAAGAVHLDGDDLRSLGGKDLARRLGILPQGPTAPEGITVADLVARGRTPHQGWFGGSSADDDEAVADALDATDTADLADRAVDELSGGQRQRVWIAMALAQRTEVLLLDEPTTYLDLAHAVEVLELVVERNRAQGTTVVVVLHDLGLAARYGDHMVAMSAGAVVASGTPTEVLTPATVADVFGMEVKVVTDPVAGTPMVVPVGRRGRRGSAHPTDPDGVTDEATPREVVAPPHPDAAGPVDRVDPPGAAFIAASPMVVLATVGDDGSVTASPRGDPAGSVLVVDDGRAVLLPDRRGDGRLDSLRHVVVHPQVGLTFLVPGVEHVLRVHGRARVTRDPAVLARWDDPPALALRVDVDDVVHCGCAQHLASLWDTASWPDPATVPGPRELSLGYPAARGD